jgi:SAM-dependent methyltransferase
VTDRFAAWIASLEARHLADFTFREVARALRALSSTYVERRQKLAEGAALATAGKRAAFALFYGPLHYLLVAHLVDRLPGATARASALIDLGCGTGASGAAWASSCDGPPRIVGVDRSRWAIGEAAATYPAFGLSARTLRTDVASALRKADAASPCAILAAFTLNELPEAARDALLPQLLDRARRGDRVLVVEPIAGGVARWWGRWRGEFERAGGRADEWRLRATLPDIVARLDRAAGLDHREITGRTLWIGRGAW